MAAALGPGPAASPADDLQRCCSLLREAVADSGSAAAALVPLRPSLRRIKDDLVRVLDEAISSHNGNTALLVLGPPGTGKTLVRGRRMQLPAGLLPNPLQADGPTLRLPGRLKS